MDDLLKAAREVPSAAMHWWVGELVGMLPRSLRERGNQPKSCLLLNLSADDMTLIERTPRHGEQILGYLSEEMAGSAEADSQQALVARLNDRHYRKWPIIVRLRGDLGLRKVVDLPATAREHLGQLLYYELDRLTPFKADDVCYAWRVLETSSEPGRMQVELEMVPKDAVSQAIDLIREHGREADRIELEGSGERAPLNLIPRSSLPEDGKRRSRSFLPLLALGLAVTAVAIPFLQQKKMIKQLATEVADARAQSNESLLLRERLDILSSEMRFLVTIKNEQTTMAELLAELTGLLPDHSYINELQIRGTGIQLHGLSDKASDLISLLDQSPMLASPQFRSPVIRDPRSGKERFQISVDLVGPSS